MKILAVYSIKGGVGKTAAAVNIASLAATEGLRTLVWDLDPQAAASFYFRVKPKVKGGRRKLLAAKHALEDAIKGTDFENLDLIPADFWYRKLDVTLGRLAKPNRRLARLVRPLATDYDLMLFDCAPSISLVSENVFWAADALLVPVIPTSLSLRTWDQLRRYLRKADMANLDMLAFFSMTDRRKALHKSILASRADGRKGLLETDIPYASQVERMGLERAPVNAYAPDSAAGLAYRALWQEVRRHLGL